MLVDAHSHLNLPDYEKDLDAIIKNSLNNGVAKIVYVSGLRNEPKNVKLIGKFLAKLKDVPVEQVAKITTRNAI